MKSYSDPLITLKVKLYSPWIWVSFFAVIVSGCTTQAPPPRSTINPAERFEFEGFSVLPPQGKNWYLGRSPFYGVVFMKRLFEAPRQPKSHSFFATVYRHDLKDYEINSTQDFLSYVQWTSRVNPRFRLVKKNVVLDSSMSDAIGSECVRYDFLQEERDNPIAPQVVLNVTAHGFLCRHPSSSTFLIDAQCSERYPQGEKSALDESLRQECESFQRSVVLKPLR